MYHLGFSDEESEKLGWQICRELGTKGFLSRSVMSLKLLGPTCPIQRLPHVKQCQAMLCSSHRSSVWIQFGLLFCFSQASASCVCWDSSAGLALLPGVFFSLEFLASSQVVKRHLESLLASLKARVHTPFLTSNQTFLPPLPLCSPQS